MLQEPSVMDELTFARARAFQRFKEGRARRAERRHAQGASAVVDTDMPRDEARRVAIVARRRILLAIATMTVIGVGILAHIDLERTLDAVLSRMAPRYTILAYTLARDMSSHLAELETSGTKGGSEKVEAGEALVARALEDAQHIEREGSLVVLIHFADRDGWRTTDGRWITAAPLDTARRTAQTAAILSRTESADLGLPARTSVAGFGRIEAPPLRPIDVAVIGTAAVERDQIEHEELRALAGVLLVTGIVVMFMWFSFREQRHELELAARLSLEQQAHERDERLARADRMASLAALSTGIAHELSSPLAVVAGRVEQLNSVMEHDARSAKAVKAIDEQVARMRGVIHGFLALARGEAPELRAVDAAEVARDAERMVRHRFELAGVELAVATPAGHIVACDRMLLTQVFVNLLQNACEAKDVSHVVLTIDAAAPFVVFRVSDDGAGIDDEVAKRAMEPFFTTRTRAGGSGLGLALAREIVSHHAGTIEIGRRGVEGGDAAAGTVVTVKIPSAKEVRS